MNWTDDGIVLAARRHGEAAAIVQLLTAAHGRHAGLVRGGTSRRLRGVLQPGNRVRCTWRARLEDQLGNFSVELIKGDAALIMDDALALSALSSACALLAQVLPERLPQTGVYDATGVLISALGNGAAWPAAYVHWELGLLRELGFGLDLAACAVTGVRDDLTWVSPRTGRAVSHQAGMAYRNKLLDLPGFLIGSGPADDDAIAAGLKLTGHFLRRHVLTDQDRHLPAARERLIEGFARRATISGANTTVTEEGP